jgi:hypothetical protein
MLATIEQKFDGAAALEKEATSLRERNLEIVRTAKLVFPIGGRQAALNSPSVHGRFEHRDGGGASLRITSES